MAQSTVHKQTCANLEKICDWYDKKTHEIPFPIYSSYDIRDSGYKITNVDANIFPAGFNNICPVDKESAVGLMTNFLNERYGQEVKKIVLVTEEHTTNGYYWENVSTIKSLLEQAGRQVHIAVPRAFEGTVMVTSATGKEFEIVSATEKWIAEVSPDLIISNNDFSESFEDWGHDIKRWNMTPPREMGWYQRKKSTYFELYNELVNDFSKIADIDPFIMRVETKLFEHFDINSEESRNALAIEVDAMIATLKAEYHRRGITQEPFVFVKNNAGTYGLAVIRVSSGDEVRSWTYKSRKKMKAAKGGRDVEELIIQEGIPSIVKDENVTAEPVIYMIGSDLAGGFLRTHAEKNETESLNSPGAVYKKLCVTDLAVNTPGCPMENVYGWSAKLGLLAIGLEAKRMNVEFKGFKV